jgi:glycosyltransferase involved in cell wall biosynthesis
VDLRTRNVGTAGPVIAFLHGAPAFGAVETYVLDILDGVRARRRRAALVYPAVPELARFDAREDVERFPLAPSLVSGSTPRLVLELAKQLRRLRPNIVHVTDVWPPALVAARIARVPRLIVTHHTPELPRTDNTLGRLWWRTGWAMRPEVVYTSRSDRELDGRARSHVINYGIELDRFDAAAPALTHDGPVVGTVGRLEPQKGHALLVEAAPIVLAAHPDARFVIVGEGGLRGELEAMVRARDLDRSFVFTGPRADVPNLLASFDVFALPSYFEGLCYAVFEAQAAGVPVVATPVGGVRENVVAGETGVVARIGDAQSLADGILWTLAHPGEARALADAASRRVRERFAKQRMIDETLALYGY